MSTTVVSVRGQSRSKLLADLDFVYVGRRCAGWPASVWGNPFKPALGRVFVDYSVVREEWLRESGLTVLLNGPPPSVVDRALRLYAAWVSSSAFLLEKLPTLRGKQLGCWCGRWRPGEPEIGCHARILAQLADGRGHRGGGAATAGRDLFCDSN